MNRNKEKTIMTADQKLGIILGVTTGIGLFMASSIFLYYSALILKSAFMKIKKEC